MKFGIIKDKEKPTNLLPTSVEDIRNKIEKAREEVKNEMIQSNKMNTLLAEIDTDNSTSIIKFGKDASMQISKVSDQILGQIRMSQVDQSNKIVDSLDLLMKRFDPKELTTKPQSRFWVVRKIRDQIDTILDKYATIGGEIDVIYKELLKFEEDVEKSNNELVSLYKTNLDYYNQLVEYIIAGETAISQMESQINSLESQDSLTDEEQFELQTISNAIDLLNQRVMDLRVSENIALQTIPMLKMTEHNNSNLSRKINSAFIITLPIFKQALTQAVILKQQKLQSETMSKLDSATNELLIINAKNIVEASKQTARLAGGNSISIDTLEETWKTILDGINEVKNINRELYNSKKNDIERMENIKAEFFQEFKHTGREQ